MQGETTAMYMFIHILLLPTDYVRNYMSIMQARFMINTVKAFDQ